MAAKIGVLIRMYKGHCHYCGCKVSKSDAGKYPTRDHVVPRAFGGPNSIDNFVLSCYDCNQKRGTSLFFCECRDCRERIYDALYDRGAVNNIFLGIVAHNKPKISKTEGPNPWKVRYGHQTKRFSSFRAAMHFALNGEFVKDRYYNA